MPWWFWTKHTTSVRLTISATKAGLLDGMFSLTTSIIHFKEDTLRDSGSGKFGEFELCELMIMLEYQSRAGGSRPSRDGEEDLSQIAHELLIFVEKIVKFMKQARIKFEKNPGTPKDFEVSRK